ncbi:dTDP-4-keto-6-deoxy-L-hexose2,3-dehydratase [Parasulfuritortus cantonensis]|uniref:dTDP-4-keto-6-deoxy-L-hexose2,3-dehydratase n=1 Tax=Parasulfuritortus cantonensis TaxID=2528202 RepID=A0A4R1BMS3_9PROT|nr:NDP-hexose 2,3-dehydratase family protein [Parasulfuritortus cantonensis]TCJ18705.1 dTDP-4-keto-6-deoxy-L-hexose2,3-dehydratase [Parasulfuritortus cantonensis]
MPSPDTAIADWIAERRRQGTLEIQRIPFSACADWHFEGGRLRHRSGRFFTIVGCHCEVGPAHLAGLDLAMIDQPEVGILGFVVRRGPAGWEWLLQAKAEPGNVGGTQVGPSVQATRSNYMRVHGGSPTRMLELFTGSPAAWHVLTDVEQSEQGDRFCGKYNRNVVVEVDGAFPTPDGGLWRWFGHRELRAALHGDYVVNTDARSVICSADWGLLGAPEAGPPFARWRGRGGLGEQLLDSAAEPAAEAGYADACARLDAARRAQAVRLAPVALDALPGWRVDDWEIAPAGAAADQVVQAYAVHAEGREVEYWCQPLVASRAPGRIVLVCARHAGVLRFLLNVSFEFGLREGAQFAPSYVSGCGHANPDGLLAALAGAGAVVHASVMQSDEGGRFMASVARYEIVELPAETAAGFADAGVWASLAVLRRLSRRRGLLNNEMRSALSLLLAWV